MESYASYMYSWRFRAAQKSFWILRGEKLFFKKSIVKNFIILPEIIYEDMFP